MNGVVIFIILIRRHDSRAICPIIRIMLSKMKSIKKVVNTNPVLTTIFRGLNTNHVNEILKLALPEKDLEYLTHWEFDSNKRRIVIIIFFGKHPSRTFTIHENGEFYFRHISGDLIRIKKPLDIGALLMDAYNQQSKKEDHTSVLELVKKSNPIEKLEELMGCKIPRKGDLEFIPAIRASIGNENLSEMEEIEIISTIVKMIRNQD